MHHNKEKPVKIRALMNQIDSYFIAKVAVGHTGKFLVEVNMANGGFGEPKFIPIKPEKAPMQQGMKFEMSD